MLFLHNHHYQYLNRIPAKKKKFVIHFDLELVKPARELVQLVSYKELE